MSGPYSATFERERREQMTPEAILRLARTKGQFDVSLRWRDKWLRERCWELRTQGLLVGGRRHRDCVRYFPAAHPTQENNHAE